MQSSGPVVKQARSELSTRRLLGAAADLIAERGYERTTLAAIGERAGYSHGLVTRRFGSKEGLLWALIERMTFTWAAEHVIADEVTGPDAVVRVVEVIRDGVVRAPRELRAMYLLMFEATKPIPNLHEHMVELHRTFRASVVARVAEGIWAGSISSSVNPEAVARLVVSAVRGIAYQWVLDPADFDAVQALDELRAAVLQLLSDPRPARSR